MSATGNWKISITTPMGPQEMTARFEEAGDTLTGSIDSPIGSEPVNGTVSGSALHWTMKVIKPMPLDLTFDVTVDGDALSGTVKLGMFGNGALSGTRI